ncbi:MAG TPA: Rieske (2Fe-2S) protein [Nocardioides sp.]|nr:Rieske (2Fe-2S) protein [Nocardioides sp.]
MTAVTRRRALGGAATVGLGVPLLAACGDDGTTAADPPASDSPSQPATSGSGPSESATKEEKPPKPAKPAGLVATDDVPVGGGVVLAAEEVVVTQPTEGEFKAYSAICTHQGCVVGSVEGDQIACPCHGSRFSIADGSVTSPPAVAPLPEVPIRVSGGSIELA